MTDGDRLRYGSCAWGGIEVMGVIPHVINWSKELGDEVSQMRHVKQPPRKY
jgi:hypothetical protein